MLETRVFQGLVGEGDDGHFRFDDLAEQTRHRVEQSGLADAKIDGFGDFRDHLQVLLTTVFDTDEAQWLHDLIEKRQLPPDHPLAMDLMNPRISMAAAMRHLVAVKKWSTQQVLDGMITLAWRYQQKVTRTISEHDRRVATWREDTPRKGKKPALHTARFTDANLGVQHWLLHNRSINIVRELAALVGESIMDVWPQMPYEVLHDRKVYSFSKEAKPSVLWEKCVVPQIGEERLKGANVISIGGGVGGDEIAAFEAGARSVIAFESSPLARARMQKNMKSGKGSRKRKRAMVDDFKGYAAKGKHQRIFIPEPQRLWDGFNCEAVSGLNLLGDKVEQGHIPPFDVATSNSVWHIGGDFPRGLLEAERQARRCLKPNGEGHFIFSMRLLTNGKARGLNDDPLNGIQGYHAMAQYGDIETFSTAPVRVFGRKHGIFLEDMSARESMRSDEQIPSIRLTKGLDGLDRAYIHPLVIEWIFREEGWELESLSKQRVVGYGKEGSEQIFLLYDFATPPVQTPIARVDFDRVSAASLGQLAGGPTGKVSIATLGMQALLGNGGRSGSRRKSDEKKGA